MASAADFERMLADEARGADPKRRALAPAFLIAGRYVVSADAIGDPAEAYRIANRIIRQELEAGRTHEGPTNDEEFAEWMATREGEIVGRQRFGKSLKFRGVYSHARRELWELGGAGEVRRTYRLEGEGHRAYFRTSDSGAAVRYAHVWRHARQYVAIEGEGGPQRYGAFLFADWLSAPETLWVGVYVRCERPGGRLTAGMFFRAFPAGKPVQAAVRSGEAPVERFGPVVVGGPESGFHDPSLVERADVLRLLAVAFTEGALLSNGHNSVWNRIPASENRRAREAIERCAGR